MTLNPRHLVALFALAVAAAGAGLGVIALTRSDHGRNVQYSSAQVRRAFAAHGVSLKYTTTVSLPSGLTMLTVHRPPAPADSLIVYVAVRDAKVDWGTLGRGRYSRRLDNVVVTYGGRESQVKAQIAAGLQSLHQ